MISSAAAVVLAAGRGSRFTGESHKLLAPFRDRPLAYWAISAALEAGFDRVYVVTGAIELDPVLALISETDKERLVMVDNPDWAEGQATSLIAGVEAADKGGADAVVVGLADQPGVPAAAWRAVGAAAGPIVSATFNMERRPPVRLERSVWPDLPRTGDAGARALFRLRPELFSELPCIGSAFDIDTLEELQQWN